MSNHKLVHMRFTGYGYLCGKVVAYYDTWKARPGLVPSCLLCIGTLHRRQARQHLPFRPLLIEEE